MVSDIEFQAPIYGYPLPKESRLFASHKRNAAIDMFMKAITEDTKVWKG